MKTGIISIALLLISFSITSGEWSRGPGQEEGQDPKWVLNQIEKFYSSRPSIYHDLEYRLYPDHVSTVPHSIEAGIFITDGSRQYSRLSMIESLVVKDVHLAIDTEEKFIMISNQVHLPATGPIEPIAKMNADESGITVNLLSPDLGEIILSSAVGEIEEGRIIYKTSTYEIVKLILKYRRIIQLSMEEDSDPVSPRLEVAYLHTDLSGKGKEKLEITRYVVYQNGEWKLAPAYKEYELINNIYTVDLKN